MKLTEVLKSVATQSGIAETELKSILDNASIASIEVDDAISTRLTAPRLSMDAAKANPDLKKHFTATSLNGVDANVTRLLEEFGIDAEHLTDINAKDAEGKYIMSTFKRVETLAKKIQEIESKKAAAPTGDVKKLNDQLITLNAELKTAKESVVARETELKNGFEKERIDWAFDGILGSFNYALPKETPVDAVRAFGRTIAEKALQEKGLKIVKENGALSLKTSEGTDYFENNAKIGLNDFVQKTLANAKVLSASSTQTTTTQQTTQTHQAQPDVNTGDYMRVLDKAIAGEL